MKKDEVLITISNIGASKSYNLSKFIQKSILYSIIFLIIIFISFFYFISFLNTKVDTLKQQSTQLQIQSKNLQNINQKHKITIQNKKSKIEELGGTLEYIEEMIGIKENDHLDLIQRATLAKLSTAEKLYILQFVPNGKPLKNIKIVSKFGWRKHPITKKRSFHKGIDLRAKRKTPVFATADGVVRYVQDRNKGQYGKMIIISHNYGFETVFAHLQHTNVKVGDIIKKGQMIAKSGNSGKSTGPHLHYEVRYATKVLQPKDFINWHLKNYKSIFTKQRRVPWESLINMIKTQNQQLIPL